MPALKARQDRNDARAGFTLIEALVALTLLVAFAAALEPMMFQSRAILASGSGEIRAELLLRSLLQLPFDRLAPQLGVREGEDSGLRWRVKVEPATGEMFSSDANSVAARENEQITWVLFHVTAEVYWGRGKVIKADTLRLGATG
jgi:general secretion pathway protein I